MVTNYFAKYIKGSYWSFFDKLAEKIFVDALEKGDIFSENPLGYDPSHVDKDIFFVYNLSDKLNDLYAENGGYYQKYLITLWQWCQDLKNNKETHFETTENCEIDFKNNVFIFYNVNVYGDKIILALLDAENKKLIK